MILTKKIKKSKNKQRVYFVDENLLKQGKEIIIFNNEDKLIENEYYIISPQTVRMWDSSWDALVNQKYLPTPASMETYYANDPFKVITYVQEDLNLKPIETFKFGGGWFNLLSTKLLQLTDMPDSFGPYGVDDTYVMICCGIIKQKGYNIQQYVLENSVVIENFKYRWNPYKDYLSLIDKQIEFRQIAESNLSKEIQNFINKI